MKLAYWRYLAALVLAFLTLGSAPAWAQTYTITTNAVPDLGIVVPAATSDTTFTFSSATGAVTQSGTAVRRTAGTTRAQITVTCSNGGSGNNLCANAYIVKVGSIGAPMGKAGALGNFTVTAINGTISSSSGTNPRTFTMTPSHKNTAAVFYVGADFPITANNSAGAFGSAVSQFYVYAAPTNPTTGITVNASASTYRGVSVSGSALNFGGVVKPASGSATVTLDPSTNQRNITGTTGISAGVSRATFTITGENSLAITVSQDPILTLNRSGGGAIAVNLTRTTLPTVIGSGGSTGSQGTSTFYTGGSFTVSSGTLVGVYSGSYSTTVNYN